MGLRSAMRLTSEAGRVVPPSITASIEPFISPISNFGGHMTGMQPVSRDLAMSIPTISRARDILCGTIGTLPLVTFDKLTNTRVGNRQLIDQPDPAIPRVNTIAWLADDLKFYPQAFLQVLDVSPADGRPYRARRIDPRRVTPQIDSTGYMIRGWMVDGKLVPASGLNSLIVFNAIDEGVLSRGSQTIRTALALESAAYNMANEPAPMIHINNKGMNATEDEVDGLLSVFKRSRKTSATAYTEGDIDLNVLGWDSAQMQLVEARSHTALECARLMGLPSSFVSAESTSMTYSNTLQERRSLLDFGMSSTIRIIEDRLSMDDVTPRNQVVRFDLNAFLRGTPVERVDVTIKLLDSGIIDLDEARAMEDLAPRGNALPTGESLNPTSQTKEQPIL